ncbi:hypothetical protein L1987_71407 [Smallanthus sonchifolius]|uniref:Uncharacterized protein n=1 Tax=Smallanthus sonchifolius TaxID=185202 RepID=A0ACB9AWN9_9ASTR|nr:hypothetical protein L1987_71407 [Smallanthus sonchifolius]
MTRVGDRLTPATPTELYEQEKRKKKCYVPGLISVKHVSVQNTTKSSAISKKRLRADDHFDLDGILGLNTKSTTVNGKYEPVVPPISNTPLIHDINDRVSANDLCSSSNNNNNEVISVEK